MKTLNLILLTFLLSALDADAQNIIFSDDFSKVGKWSFWSSDKGTKEYGKEGNESYLSLRAGEGNEFVGSVKLPKPSPDAKGFKIVYVFKTQDGLRNPVALGTAPNRLRISAEPDGKIRVSGENMTISNGAQFFPKVAADQWHTMEITYDIESKTALFRLNDNAIRTVDLLKQAEPQTFVPDRIALTSTDKSQSVKYKSIIVEELK